MRALFFVALLGVFAASLAACGGDTPPSPGVDGGGAADIGGHDARVLCTSDVDCNDGLFCNGREMCAPVSSMADLRGCVPGDPPCSAAETCDEVTNDCRLTCEDVDGDGHEAIACGGDDCDDTDASRYPGNAEVCDVHDEDCNDATYGFVDADGDGAASSACCNGTACGGDCDDGNADIHPGVLDGPPDLCNTLDDDCDGSVDEGCPCTTGTETPCYRGPAGTNGVGRCAPGYQLCVGGMLQDTCNAQQLPETESCDGIDNDCDGLTDEDVRRRYYRDGDADGFGLATESLEACSPPAGYVSASNDCADDDNNINPGAFDGCNGVDDDCDGTVDEGAPPRTFHRDADGDGFGATAVTMRGCEPPAGYILDGTDCDDAASATNPAAFERCDGLNNDCDTMTDEGCACTDGASMPCDVSAVGSCRAGSQLCVAGVWGSCLGSVRPATEICNGLDDDCDGSLDEGVTVSCFLDADSDGFGAGAGTPRCADASRAAFGNCPSGYTNVSGDCNDANAATRPGGAEVCDAGNVDDNCNGSNNEGCACANGAIQVCGGGGRAGVGICRSGTQRCVSGAWLPCEGNVEPAASETCNGLDDNCVGGVDDGVTISVWVDSDGDTYGVGAASVACAASPGFAVRAGDCNDANPAVRPLSVEICNGIDDNCVGGIDEGLTVPLCYADGDSDGYGAGSTSTRCRDATRSAYGFCPVGSTTIGGDCNDAIASISPAGVETCNGLDDDCDLMIDDGVLNTYWCDSDRDAFGRSAACGATCSGVCTRTGCVAPPGYVAPGTSDCDDSNASIYPGATEVCDSTDQDCTPGNEPRRTFYRDADGDLYGAIATTTLACSPPVGYVELVGDCNDANGAVRPGATEICNAVDDDCDVPASVDEGAAAQCYGQYPLAVNVLSWGCTAGSCVPTCQGSWRDCDGSLASGCEVDTSTSPDDCGACGVACGTGGVCTAGSCDRPNTIRAGGANTCVVRTNQRVVCWGDGGEGEIGDGRLLDASVPTVVPDLYAISNVSIGHPGSSGSSRNAAIHAYSSSSNLLYGWGYNFFGAVGDGTRISPRARPVVVTSAQVWGAFSSGYNHTCALHQTPQEVRCWGQNNTGQLGQVAACTPVESLTPSVLVQGSANAIDVASGYAFSCMVIPDPAMPINYVVRCWGWRSDGRLGDGAVAGNACTPVTTMVPSSFSWNVEIGANHACAVNAAGTAYCWGDNSSGQLGDGTIVDRSVPIIVGGGFVWSQLTLGLNHTCGLTTGGRVYCWGGNASGQVGVGVTGGTYATPQPVGVATDWRQVAAGELHTCALNGAYDVFCWGENGDGQLGAGTVVDRNVPTAVVGL